MKIKNIYIYFSCTNLKLKKNIYIYIYITPKLVGVNSGIKSSIFQIEDIKSSEN